MSHVLALPNGTVLAADYRIERVLGAGGFGITYLADESALHRLVTIKEYFPADFAHRTATHGAVPRSESVRADYQWGLDRFIAEAQTLAKFDHRNIVKVYRYFQANNTAYMVLQFEEGHSLKGWLKSLGRAPRQRELDQILAPLLDALEVVHAADFLHRDIAPDNIMIRKDGSPVLIDFGSARGEIAQHSRTLSALVKPGYSPYEQYSETGHRQGPWTDIYALGATLYHAITGKRPPDAPGRVVKDDIAPAKDVALSAYRASFLKAIDRALSIDIDRRPQSIAAWRGDLLAPDQQPQRTGWLRRSDPAAAPEPVVATRPLDPALPPLPDAPGAQGGFLDFVDGLKQTPAAGDKPASAGKEPPRPEQPSSPKAEPAGGLLARVAEVVQSPLAQRGNAEPAKAKSNGSKAKPKAKDDVQQQPPAGVPAKGERRELEPIPARRKPTRPRPASGGRTWRPFAFKLAVGAVIAAVVVQFQDQIPGQNQSPAPPAAPKAAPKVEKRAETPPRPRQEVRTVSAQVPATVPTPTVTAPLPVVQPSAQTPATQPSSPPTTTASLPPAASEAVPRSKLQGHRGGATAVAYSPDGRSVVTAGTDATLKIWAASGGELLRTIDLDGKPATSVAVVERRAATGHADGAVVLWNIDSGDRIASFRRNDTGVESVAFGGGPGRVLASSSDWMVTLWDEQSPATPVHVFEGHDSAVQAIAVSPGGTSAVSGGADRMLRLWNLKSQSLVRTYRNRVDVTALTFSPDGKVIASAGRDGKIRLWSAVSGRLFRVMNGHASRIGKLSYSPAGDLLASASEDGRVRLWDPKRGKSLRTMGTAGGVAANSVAFTPDGRQVAIASADGAVSVWSALMQRGREDD